MDEDIVEDEVDEEVKAIEKEPVKKILKIKKKKI